jgi:two-component system, NarL family, sensor histidine kinase BarA
VKSHGLALRNLDVIPEDRPGWARTFVLLAMALVPVAVAAAVLRAEMTRAWPPAHYLAVHTIVETLVVVVAFATFAVQWYAAGAHLNDARARFIGSAFLAVGLLETVHIVAFPGMPGLLWLESSTERGIVYWLSARLWTVGALLAVLAVPRDSESAALRRVPLLAFALGGVAAVLALDYAWISRQPLFFVEGTGLTALKKWLEALVAAGAFVGMLVYGRMHLTRGDQGARTLSLALGLTVISELCFTLYAHAYDSFNLLGHVYLLLAFYGIFHALFADAVIRPYARLDAASRELAASNAELERLRAHIEGELAVTIRDLQSLQEQREDLLRAVSHDLRTPLNVVLLQARSLGRSTPAGTRERTAADTIAAAGHQMAQIIRDLVDLAQFDSGMTRLSTRPVALRTIVSGFLDVARGALDTDRVRVDIGADLPPVAADPDRLTRVVQNLVGNALKYGAPGTPVMVRAWRADGEVVVSVSDTGAGVPPEDTARVFERFYRGVRNGTSDGLGLGLYISRLIVEAHGGRIWCESRPGHGSTFSFALPLTA